MGSRNQFRFNLIAAMGRTAKDLVSDAKIVKASDVTDKAAKHYAR